MSKDDVKALVEMRELGRKQGALEELRKVQSLINWGEPETSLERICQYIEKELEK